MDLLYLFIFLIRVVGGCFTGIICNFSFYTDYLDGHMHGSNVCMVYASILINE